MSLLLLALNRHSHDAKPHTCRGTNAHSFADISGSSDILIGLEYLKFSSLEAVIVTKRNKKAGPT